MDRWTYQAHEAKGHYRARGAPKTRCGRAMLGPRLRDHTRSSDHTGTVQNRNTTRDWDEVTCKLCLRHKPKTVWERLDHA